MLGFPKIHQNGPKSRDEKQQQRRHLDGITHVLNKRLDFLFEIWVPREDFRFQFFSVKNMSCPKLNSIPNEYAVYFKDFSPKIEIYKKHGNK
jgi:hypothetical protein